MKPDKEVNARHLELWKNITRAHSQARWGNLRALWLMLRPHDYISILMESYAWTETFRVLNTTSDANPVVIERYADANLKIAEEQLKRIWIYYSAFLVPAMGFLITQDLWKHVFGWTSFLVAIGLIFLGVQTFIGYQRAFSIKISVECYINARLAPNNRPFGK